MRHRKESIFIKYLSHLGYGVLLLFSVDIGTAWAENLEALRASGAIGESSTGYVVAREGSAQVDAQAINAKRKSIYQEKASAQGVSVDQVGKVYAKEIFSTVPVGTWIQVNGQWMRK